MNKLNFFALLKILIINFSVNCTLFAINESFATELDSKSITTAAIKTAAASSEVSLSSSAEVSSYSLSSSVPSKLSRPNVTLPTNGNLCQQTGWFKSYFISPMTAILSYLFGSRSYGTIAVESVITTNEDLKKETRKVSEEELDIFNFDVDVAVASSSSSSISSSSSLEQSSAYTYNRTIKKIIYKQAERDFSRSEPTDISIQSKENPNDAFPIELIKDIYTPSYREVYNTLGKLISNTNSKLTDQQIHQTTDKALQLSVQHFEIPAFVAIQLHANNNFPNKVLTQDKEAHLFKFTVLPEKVEIAVENIFFLKDINTDKDWITKNNKRVKYRYIYTTHVNIPDSDSNQTRYVRNYSANWEETSEERRKPQEKPPR